jgi:MAP/microtubule affinity-regulating kinase
MEHSRSLKVARLSSTPEDNSSPIVEEDANGSRVQLRMIGNYCVERTIGKGQFGKVKLAYHKKIPDMKVAIKIINKTKLDEDTLKMIQREVHIMKLLQHQNIIRLYEVLETPRTLYLIMEYAEGGEVMDFIIAHGKIPEREAKRFFAQTLAAVQYCHSKRCCHRDLKPENLLLDSNMNVKIIDFGLSNTFQPDSLMKTFCGSPTYASPELILRKEYLGPPVDVWSMGVVLFVLVCGYLPFDGHNFVELFNKILKVQYTIPSHVSPDCADLIKKMLVVDPEQRATIEQIRKHPWLSSVQDCMPDVHAVEITDESKVNQTVLTDMEALGFNKEQVVQSLLKNTFDDSSATYFLLESKRHLRKFSISSMTHQSISSPMPTPPTTFSMASPPSSPPASPPTASTVAKPATVGKKVGFHLAKDMEKARGGTHTGVTGGGSGGGSGVVHRRAASEAMKEQMLKQAKAHHEMLKAKEQQVPQFSTPQTKPPSLMKEDSHLTPTLQHTSTAPAVRHTAAPDDDNKQSPPSDHSDQSESGIARSPSSSKMSSFISTFRSMWKHKEKAKEADEPRVVRFAFHVNTMSDKSPDEIIREVQTILKQCEIPFTIKGKFCANCVVDNVSFSIEVCKIPRLSVNGIRFSRISGSAWKYKTIVKDLVVHMKL